MLIPGAAHRAEHRLEWWLSNWEPSYREVRVTRSPVRDDLSDIAYDAGVQLGARESQRITIRKLAQASVTRLEGRFAKRPPRSLRNCSLDGASSPGR